MLAIAVLGLMAVTDVSAYAVAIPVELLPWSTTRRTTPRPTSIIDDTFVEDDRQPVISSCRCCAFFDCRKDLEPYIAMLGQSDFAKLASDMDQLCHEAVPLVQLCQDENRGEWCGVRIPDMIIFEPLCAVKSAFQRGFPCWRSGVFRSTFHHCKFIFQYVDGPKMGACQAVYNLKECVVDSLVNNDACAPRHIDFIVDFIHNNTLNLCPRPLPFPADD